MRDYLYILIIAAAVTYMLTPLVRRGSIAFGALHAARSRDVHKEPTPLLGGVAMYGGLVAALLVADRLSYLRQAFPSSRTIVGLLLAGGLLVLVGIVDDRWGMGAISKLAAQIAAGGILMWSGVYLSWLPLPGGQIFSLEPDLSATLTILIVVITINAVNFIDGLDGLAAGVVAVAALSFLVWSYTLSNSVGIPSQSVPAVASAVLAGICLGFLPHNFHPARIFMGDTGAMLLGLLLAYGPISSMVSLDPNILINYSHGHPVNRYPAILPLLLPVAILIIPYADLLLAVIRRTKAGKSPLAADREHLHHRLMNLGHSHRQSVLIMYLWAALFSGTVVGLSQVRIRLIWLALATAGAMLALLVATMPRLRPWRSETNGSHRARGAGRARSGDPVRLATNGAVPMSGTETGNGTVPPTGIPIGGLPAYGVVSTNAPLPANAPLPDGQVPDSPPPARGPFTPHGPIPPSTPRSVYLRTPPNAPVQNGPAFPNRPTPSNGPVPPNSQMFPNGPVFPHGTVFPDEAIPRHGAPYPHRAPSQHEAVPPPGTPYSRGSVSPSGPAPSHGTTPPNREASPETPAPPNATAPPAPASPRHGRR